MKRRLFLISLLLSFTCPFLTPSLSQATDIQGNSDRAILEATLTQEQFENGADEEMVMFSRTDPGVARQGVDIHVPLKLIREYYAGSHTEINSKEIQALLIESSFGGALTSGKLEHWSFSALPEDNSASFTLAMDVHYTYYRDRDLPPVHDKVALFPTFHSIVTFDENPGNRYVEIINDENTFYGTIPAAAFTGSATETFITVEAGSGVPRHSYQLALADLLSGGILNISNQLPATEGDAINPGLTGCGRDFRNNMKRGSNPERADNSNIFVTVKLLKVEKMAGDQYAVELKISYGYHKERGMFFPWVVLNTSNGSLSQCPETDDAPREPEVGIERPERDIPELDQSSEDRGADEIFPDLPDGDHVSNQEIPDSANTPMVHGGGFLSCSLPALAAQASMDWLILLPLLIPVIRRKRS